MHKLFYTKQALKDAKKIKQSHLQGKVQKLLNIIQENLHQKNPSYDKLMGDLTGACSRRINIQHRLIYEIIEARKAVKIIRMWTYYE